MSFVELKNIYKTYRMGEVDVPVLRGVTCTIDKGSMVALMGSSGSGKSTLMNIMGCLDRVSSGEYWLDGEEVSMLSQDGRAMLRNRKIGFVFQSFNLLPRTSALENVMMPLSYGSDLTDESQERERAEQILKRVGLADRIHHLTSQLSGGQQQRVAIARSLINHPQILFADEPTGNLDSKTSGEVLDLFSELHQAEGITIILVTHESDVASRAKRIIKLRDGQIEEDRA